MKIFNDKIFGIAAALYILFFVLPNEAYAYLDPGTGSMVIQVIIATFAAIACTFKIWYSKIKGIFTKNKDNETDAN